jgi:hypothetical protein
MAPMLAAAKPWFYWLAVVLTALGVLSVVATAVGYYVKVLANKAHRR